MSPPSPARTLRVLARLASYPDDELRARLPEMCRALQDERALGRSRLAELEALAAMLAARPPLEVEAAYVDLFDRGRSTSLHLFEHVHGDSRDRGTAMVDLVRTYEQAGLMLVPGELPDHLGVALEFASTQPPSQARAFLREIARIVRSIMSALLARQSPYASVLAAVLDLAGEKAQAIPLAPDPGLDESWEEPPAFDGCSTRGQARPGQPQPVRIVRTRSPGATPPGAEA
jgi:nitrate reductase delta subunit